VRGLHRPALYRQRLLALLIQDPPVSYAEISTRLGISIGSIGPMLAPLASKISQAEQAGHGHECEVAVK
jgi:hypothetical protein